MKPVQTAQYIAGNLKIVLIKRFLTINALEAEISFGIGID